MTKRRCRFKKAIIFLGLGFQACVFLLLAVFLYGNSQWNKWIYIARYHYSPIRLDCWGNEDKIDLYDGPKGYTGIFRKWDADGTLKCEKRVHNGALAGFVRYHYLCPAFWTFHIIEGEYYNETRVGIHNDYRVTDEKTYLYRTDYYSNTGKHLKSIEFKGDTGHTHFIYDYENNSDIHYMEQYGRWVKTAEYTKEESIMHCYMEDGSCEIYRSPRSKKEETADKETNKSGEYVFSLSGRSTSKPTATQEGDSGSTTTATLGNTPD